MWLVYHNVPWDEAFSLNTAWRHALCIMFSEFEGSTFDYRTMEFIEKVPST